MIDATITPDDTVATVALKLRVRDLEMENGRLRVERGVWDRPFVSPIEDLPTLETAHVRTLQLAGGFQAHFSPVTGRLHAIGRWHGEDGIGFDYFAEGLDQMYPNARLQVLGELHKRLLRDLAKRFGI